MRRRYLTLDRYMSGSFLPLFGWTVLLSSVAFLVIWGMLWLLGVNWTILDAFIQLTNPSTSGDGNPGASPIEWVAIVLTNLFGLFVLNGVILTLLVNWVSNRKDRHEKGEARYDYIFDKQYAVIIGGHKIVASLARDLLVNNSYDFVLIQTQRDAAMVRREIAAEITDKDILKSIVIYSGDRTSWHELEELHLATAQEIYIIGEPSYIDKSSHDSINMQTWKLMNQYIKTDLERRIPCHIMFEYQSTFSAFQYTDLKLEDSRAFRFIPFSIYENWAQQVLICRNTIDNPYYLPLDGMEGLPYSSHQRAHLIIVGMSKMGVALAIEAAHVAHYPNFNNPEAGRPRTLITFIDRNAKREMLFFMGRFRELFQLARWRYVKAPDGVVVPGDDSWDIYDTIEDMTLRLNTKYPWHYPMQDADFRSPYYGEFLGKDLIDIDFEFIEGDVALPAIQKYISDACADNGSKAHKLDSESHAGVADSSSKTTIAICFPIAAESMSAALYLASDVYANVQQIWVQQPESGALADAIRYGLTGQDNAKFRALRPFGMIEQCDYLERIHSILPKLVAYAYECLPKSTLSKEYHKIGNLKNFVEIVEDNWLKISQDGGKSTIAKRWSNLYCANSFDTKIRATGMDVSSEENLLDDNTIKLLAAVEHNRWVMEQLLLGFRPVDRSYEGKLPITDQSTCRNLKSRNIHPDLVSNEMLGVTKMYDEEIAKIIPIAMAICKQIDMNDD